MINKASWSIMTLSAIGVAIYALALLIEPNIRPLFVQNLFLHFPNFTKIHFLGGAIAILIGAFQLSSSIRRKYLYLHRILGRIYVGSVAFGGLSGFILAVNSVGGAWVQTGFALMAIFWLGTTLNAYRVILQRDVKSHERWMVRSYAVTLAGVTLRLYLGLSVVLGIKFIDAYPILAWLCWVPNLLVAELYLWFKLNKVQTFNKSSLSDSY
ncbi:DUF2306 domain-containing protein [Microbulbifer discodermiae]|uniref:DUF2306 domain-containing protein n=1 Tax=Microbulbifer sp. 2201CG32-9 TaxID=3232309 RepID=UPI00345BB70D